MLCLAHGCDGGESPDDEVPLNQGSSTGCPNEADALAGDAVLQGPLAGDVTGDGDADEVFLAIDEGAEVGCRAFLWLRSGEEIAVTSVAGEGVEVGLGLPALLGLKQIDGRRGSDIIVDIATGASTRFAGVYIFSNASLRQLEVEGSRPPVEDLFAHGGGVGQLSAVDCARDGTVIISTAVPGERLYEVDRITYEVDDEVLRRNPAKDVRERARLQRIPRLFPEFAGPPFSSCPDA